MLLNLIEVIFAKDEGKFSFSFETKEIYHLSWTPRDDFYWLIQFPLWLFSFALVFYWIRYKSSCIRNQFAVWKFIRLVLYLLYRPRTFSSLNFDSIHKLVCANTHRRRFLNWPNNWIFTYTNDHNSDLCDRSWSGLRQENDYWKIEAENRKLHKFT